MSSFCKIRVWLFLLTLFVLSNKAMAAQFFSIYSAGCKRDTGIIINVNNSVVQLLQLDGSVKEIKRFDIIYIAKYPFDRVDIPKIEFSEKVPVTKIFTRHNGEVTELLTGWLSDYSGAKLSFFTTNNTEEIVSIEDIWDVQIEERTGNVYFPGVKSLKQDDFTHPYPFASCKTTAGRQINPQRLINTPLLIKQELDYLQAGYEKIEFYIREKVFYPEPQIYENKTLFGLGAGFGLRYGESKDRNSSFIPSLRNEFSAGLFDFQRVVISGSAPMPYSVHAESQTQLLYSLKSGYVHSLFMVDPTQFLIGSRYKWSDDSLEKYDIRQHDAWHMGVGFDWSNYAIDYSASYMFYAVRHDNHFYRQSRDIGKVGVHYRIPELSLAFYVMSTALGLSTGGGSEEGGEALLMPSDNETEEQRKLRESLANQSAGPDIVAEWNIYRINADWEWSETLTLQYSLIYRSSNFELTPTDNTDDTDDQQRERWALNSSSFVNALYATWAVPEWDVFISGFASIEMLETENNETEESDSHHSEQKNYFKIGSSVGFIF